jgi:competence protein ComEC
MTSSVRAGGSFQPEGVADSESTGVPAVGPGTVVNDLPERQHDLRLLLPGAAAWGTAWWAVAAAFPVLRAVFLLTAATAVTGIVGTVLHRRRSCRRTVTPSSVPVVIVLMTIVSTLILGISLAQRTVREAEPLRDWIREEAVVTVQGQLRNDPHRISAASYDSSDRYVLTITSHLVQGRGTQLRVSVPLLVLGGADWAAPHAGQRVRLVGRLVSTEPGDDVAALVLVHGPPQQLREGQWWWTVADRLRSGLRDATDGLPPDAGALLPSLVVGDVSQLPEDLVEDLRASGLSHLTAVSGANVAIVVGAVLLLSVRLRLGRRLRAVLGGGAVVAFVVLARPEPSVLRAAVMASVALIGLATSRRSRGGPALAAAVILLLAVDPWLGRNPGFALSVSATGGLLWLAPAWAGRLRRWMPRPAALALAAPAAAQAACGPVLVLLDPSLSTVSVPANLLAGPAVAPATVLGVLAAAVSVLSPSAASVLAVPAGVATGWIATVAHRAADLPGASVPWVAGPAGAVLLLGLTASVIVASLWGRPGNRAAGVPPRDSARPLRPGARDRTSDRSSGRPGPTAADASSPRAGALRGRMVIIVLGMLALGFGWWLPSLFDPDHGNATDWAVAQCDVGQGDAMVLRSGPEAGVLVDVGPDPGAIDTCLRDLGVTTLHLVLLTHAHADHVGGLSGALRDRPVAEVVVDPLGLPGPETQEVRRQLADRGIDPRVGRAGTTGFAGEGSWSVQWRVLSAGAPSARSRGTGTDDTAINDASIVTVMEIRTPTGLVRVLALADVETDGQDRLVELLREQPALLGGAVDLVKVAHHGSRSQNVELYRMSRAGVALISCGEGNDYGHPSEDTLDFLTGLGMDVLRTDRDGLVTVHMGRDGPEVATGH